MLSQNAANVKTSALGQAGNSRDGKTDIRIGGSKSGDDDAPALAPDPVALAMLLVASGNGIGQRGGERP